MKLSLQIIKHTSFLISIHLAFLFPYNHSLAQEKGEEETYSISLVQTTEADKKIVDIDDKRVLTGFVEKIYITKEMQKSYMKIYCNNYKVCLLKNDPVGFVGVIDNDIRICVHPDHQQKGIGKFILREIFKLYPQAKGRIKKGNISSQRLFKKCKVPFEII